MRLSASNIAWTKEYDEEMYTFLKEEGIEGLEIAPTRIFPEKPYERLKEAADFADSIKEKYCLTIPSMQSIWFGRKENIFSSEKGREILLSYTKQAIDFAAAAGCKNLVFGCPRNRAYQEGDNLASVVPFFKELGDYAAANGTVLAMEANPPIYNTNYCNTTAEALALIKEVGSRGFLLNLDVGTMIQNREGISIMEDAAPYINHIHISEPGLAPVLERSLHIELAEFLKETGYQGYVSLEIKTQEDIAVVKKQIEYIKEVFQ